MRDSHEKGAGMRDQDPPFQTLSKDNVVAAMLVEPTKRANEKPLVYDHQHGWVDVSCKPRVMTSFSWPKG